MERAADRKIHFAPFRRQEQQIKRLLRTGHYRNVTHFMRAAIDSYLERLGRPSLVEQARQMAADHQADRGARRRASLQDTARASAEEW